MKTTFIYALCEPGTGKIRYVGKSNDPHRRFTRHCYESKKLDTYLGRWLRTLKGEPTLEVLDEIPDSQWQFWEREYIRVFRALGMNLTNTTEGGEGGGVVSSETRAKISRAGLGRRVSLETRIKIGNSNRNPSVKTRAAMSLAASNRTPEHREKLSVKAWVWYPERRAKLRAANTGKKHSPETCKKLSILALNRTPEHLDKMRAAATGKVPSLETRNKLSSALKAYWAKKKPQKDVL